MNIAITLLMIAIPLLYYPLYPLEEFESVKTAALISFACFSLIAVQWKQLLTNRIAKALLFFTISCGISTIFSLDTHMSIFGNPKLNNGVLVSISYLVLYLAASKAFQRNDYQEKRRLVRFIILTAFIVSLYAIAQVTGHDFKQWFGTLYEGSYMRPISSLGHPNFMAAYLAMVLPFVLWRLDIGIKLEKIFMPIVGIAMTLAIIFSQSRGMWWSAIVGVITYQVMSRKPLRRMISFAVIGLVLIISSLLISKNSYQGMIDRVKQMTILGGARVEYLKGALRIAKKYPWTGSGTDTFEVAFQHQRSKHYWDIETAGSPHRAHNEFLNTLATQGILGALAGLFLILAIIKAIKESNSFFRIPSAASIITFFVQEISSFHVVATGSLFIICLVLIQKRRTT